MMNRQSNFPRALNHNNRSLNPITSIAHKSVGNLSQTLGSVQQVLKIVQSAGPVIEEYAPMIRNLPAMYKMIKSINQLDKTEDNKEQSTTTNSLTSAEQLEEREKVSRPKLYI